MGQQCLQAPLLRRSSASCIPWTWQKLLVIFAITDQAESDDGEVHCRWRPRLLHEPSVPLLGSRDSPKTS